jgi:hypothetical protein
MDLQPASSQPVRDVFSDLERSNRELALNRVQLRLLCSKLAAMNGSGDGIRRRILYSLTRLVEVQRGISR